MKIFKLFINANDFIAYAGEPNIDFVVNPMVLIEKSGHMFSKKAMIHLNSFKMIFSGGNNNANFNVNSRVANQYPNMIQLHMGSINNYSSYCSAINGTTVPNNSTSLTDILASIPATYVNNTGLGGNGTIHIAFYHGNLTKDTIGIPIQNLNFLNTNIRFYLTDEAGGLFNLTADGVNNKGGLPSFEIVIYDPEDDEF